MEMTIDIPKEFEANWLNDIEESLGRLMADAHSLAGNYEKETAQMLINAFKEGDVSGHWQNNDLISRQAVIDILMELITNGTNKGMISGEVALHRVEVLPSAQQWTPIKWHDCTDEDREKYGFSNDIVAVFDCEMPDDGESILVTTSHGYVGQDMCYIDDGYSLDSGYDWIDDITAWMPLPGAYEERREDG